MTAKERFDKFKEIAKTFAQNRPPLKAEFFKLDDPDWEKLPEQTEGDLLVTYVKRIRTATNALESLVFGDETGDSIFPGGLLWAGPLRDSGRLDIAVPPKRTNSLNISVSSAIMKPGVPATFQSDGSKAGFTAILDTIRHGFLTASAKVSAKFTSLTDTSAASLELGISAKGWGAHLDASIKDKLKTSRSVRIVSIEQAYFTLDCSISNGETLFSEDMFENAAFADNLLDIAADKGELGLISRVTYGRRLLLTFISSASSEELVAAINAGYSAVKAGVELKLGTDHEKTLAKTEAVLVMLGGKTDADLTAGIVMPATDLLKSLSAYLKRTSDYDEDTPPEVTSFQVRYTYDLASLVKADSVNFSEQVRDSIRRKGGIINTEVLSFSSERAALVEGDTEIDSDDWTYTRVKYSLSIKPDKRAVELHVDYDAREGNDDKSFGDTWFRISETVEIYRLATDDPRSIRTIQSEQSKDLIHWFEGGKDGFQHFPDFGVMSNVMVSFDADGDHDLDQMKIKCSVQLQLELSPGPSEKVGPA